MKRFYTLLALATLVVAGASRTQAATVTFDLVVDENGPGTFNLYASTGLDNFGIAAYGVPLNGGILTINHMSPRAIDGNDGQPVGFTFLRSNDNDFNPVRASQDTINPTPHLVRGFGQTAGDLNSAPGVVGPLFATEQLIYGAPLLLATGTWDGVIPGYNFSSPDLGSNVFTAATGIAVTPADIVTLVSVVPEPGTIVLAVVGGLGLLVASRRRLAGRRS